MSRRCTVGVYCSLASSGTFASVSLILSSNACHCAICYSCTSSVKMIRETTEGDHIGVAPGTYL